MTALLTATAADILTAALEYNAGYFEHDPALLAEDGAYISVTLHRDRRGDGSRVRAVITPIIGLEGEDGGYAAADPEVKWLRVFDGRLSPEQTARRATRYLGVDGAQVPVIFKTR